MTEEQPPPHIAAMAQAAVGLTQMAHEAGGAALIMHPYGGPPPPAEFFLTMMRVMVETSGDAMGCICIGAGDDAGMLPLVDIHPVDALHEVLHVRLAKGIPKVDWVTLSIDSYDLFLTDQNDERIAKGAMAAFEAGDPDASEALKVICVAPDGPGYDVTQRYVRTGDAIEWEEPEATESIVSIGEMGLLMNELVLA